VIHHDRPSRLNLVLAMAVALFILAPVLVLVPMSFSASRSFEFPPRAFSLGHYAAYFQSEAWLSATANSLAIAAGCSVLTLLLSVPAAFALNRRQFRGQNLARALLLLPMLVPSIIMAISYYTLYAEIGLNQTYAGVLMAHAAGSIPLALIALSATVRGFDRNLERAAAICGATPWQGFRMVTLPLITPAIVVAGIFAFVHSFDEAVISLFIAGREVNTLPRRAFESIRLDADPVLSVVSTLTVVLVILLFSAVSLLRRRAAIAR
jgi:putative spermidine/putrescine transport system permease protein